MRTFANCCLLLVAFSFVGCGGGEAEDRPDVVPVAGTLIGVDGNPVAGATVEFWKEGAPRSASDVTDADGKFVLTMFELEDGAMPGENKVTVVKAAPGAATATSADPTQPQTLPRDTTNVTQAYQAQMPNPGEEQPDSVSELPARYASQGTTPLIVTIPAGGDKAVILRLEP